jgi:hypothetical protein
MAPPETQTTKIIRSLPTDASLEAVNDALIAEDLAIITKKQLTSRRYLIAQRDGGARRSTSSTSIRVPQAGTFAEFVVSLPFDMPAAEVWRRGCEAGFTCTQAAVRKTRKKYDHLKNRFKNGEGLRMMHGSGNGDATSTALVTQPVAAPVQRRSSPEPDLRTQLAVLIVRAGVDTARSVLDEIQRFALRTGGQ